MRSKIILILIGLGLTIGFYKMNPVFNKSEKTDAEGVSRETETEQKKILFVVVIDNAPEARPQPGLESAEIVIETLAEGPATRYLAFFNDEEIEKIGPVRSARPYFLDWADGLNLPFVHSGGSREALARIQSNSQVKDVNEFAYENYFWRDKARRAPHNLFTSTKLIKELIERKGWAAVDTLFKTTPSSSPSPRLRSDEAGPSHGGEKAEEISVNFSTPNFAVDYKYDPVDNSYARFLAGKPHQDIKAKNIVVLQTSSRVIDQKLLTIDIETQGSGKAVVFRDGQIIQARWRKLGKTSPLELLDADGTQIQLNPGQTWIEVLDQRGSVEWK